MFKNKLQASNLAFEIFNNEKWGAFVYAPPRSWSFQCQRDELKLVLLNLNLQIEEWEFDIGAALQQWRAEAK